jgi:hypothetical protein
MKFLDGVNHQEKEKKVISSSNIQINAAKTNEVNLKSLIKYEHKVHKFRVQSFMMNTIKKGEGHSIQI